MAKQFSDRSIRSATPLPAIRIGTGPEREGLADQRVLLATFMRIVAILWIVEGLLQWVDVLADANGTLFATASLQRVSAVVFFCILDLVAAVGLWLAAPWGGVVWLVTVGGQLLSLAFLPGFSDHPWIVGVRNVVLVAGYLSLAWMASQQEEKQNR